MIKLAHNIHLWAFLLLAILVILFSFYTIYRKQLIHRIGNSSLISKLTSSTSLIQRNIKFGIIIIAFTCLVIAWANPLIGTKYEKVSREGVDIIFAIDVSKSMDAEDVVPSRMRKAKQLVANIFSGFNNLRVGLIIFAGKAYLQMTITVDYSSSKMYLNSINTNLVPSQGTSISDAVNLALNSFEEESQGFKTLVIISDGEEHDGNAEQIIEKAKKQGVTTYTIGVGSKEGGTIPIDKNGNFKKDSKGEVIHTKLNEEMLIELAKIGGGKYFNASNIDVAPNIITAINNQEKKKLDEKVFTNYKNHFPLFLSFALVLLLLDFIISERKYNLFNKNK